MATRAGGTGLGDVRIPPMSAALPKGGWLSFWRGEQPLLQALESIYLTACQVGLDLVVGEQPVFLRDVSGYAPLDTMESTE